MKRIDPKVRAFRDKHERDLRRLVTIGCGVACSAYEGDGQTEEEEMDAFAAIVIDIVEKAKRAARKPQSNVVELVIENKANPT